MELFSSNSYSKKSELSSQLINLFLFWDASYGNLYYTVSLYNSILGTYAYLLFRVIVPNDGITLVV